MDWFLWKDFLASWETDLVSQKAFYSKIIFITLECRHVWCHIKLYHIWFTLLRITDKPLMLWNWNFWSYNFHIQKLMKCYFKNRFRKYMEKIKKNYKLKLQFSEIIIKSFGIKRCKISKCYIRMMWLIFEFWLIELR